MKEIAYAAFIPPRYNKWRVKNPTRKEKMICFSFDINEFFNYLKNLYKSFPELELSVKKFIVDDDFIFQSLYSQLELVEIAQNVYLTYWECVLWELYMRGLYEKSLGLLRKGRLNEKGYYWLDNFDRFIQYFKPDALQNMINESRFTYEDYELYLEFHSKIEDN